jgi:hypothetical protein
MVLELGTSIFQSNEAQTPQGPAMLVRAWAIAWGVRGYLEGKRWLGGHSWHLLVIHFLIRVRG